MPDLSIPVTITILLNMVWPAIYIASGLAKLWYCIFFTIAIEWIILKFFLKDKWGKTLVMSAIGNVVSGLAGIFIMPWVMILWHFIADRFMPDATFDNINWFLSYVFMCIGSVALEAMVVMLTFKKPFKKLIFSMLIGNALTYLLIGILIAMGILASF
jgi:hypothetical protein